MLVRPGTQVLLDATLGVRFVDYERPLTELTSPNSPASHANSGNASMTQPGVLPFLGVISDFGSSWFAAGFAAYAPFGGSASWDKSSEFDGDPAFPGAVDGVQRWYGIEASMRSMYLTGALAFRISDWRLNLGLNGSAIHTKLKAIRARNPDGSDDMTTGGENALLKEGRSLAQVDGWQAGFGVGALWEAVPSRLWIGLSYTSKPNVAGGMRLTGHLTNVFATLEARETPVEMTQDFPDIIRLGLRARITERLELRLFGDYQRWSVFDKQCVLDVRESNRNCNFDGVDRAIEDPESYGSPTGTSGVVQHFPRLFVDAFTVRAGASYWFAPELETFLGAGYESSAIPVEMVDPLLFDNDKVTLSAGIRWQLKRLKIGLSYTQYIFFDLDTAGKNVLNRFRPPTRQPGANGVYSQLVSVFNLHTDFQF
jgi:long-chain fatty acid transport protein